MMMARFYDSWRTDRTSIADALRRSQCWLRDSTNQEKARWFSEQLDRCDPDDTETIDSLRKLWQASVRKPPTDRTYAHPQIGRLSHTSVRAERSTMPTTREIAETIRAELTQGGELSRALGVEEAGQVRAENL